MRQSVHGVYRVIHVWDNEHMRKWANGAVGVRCNGRMKLRPYEAIGLWNNGRVAQ